jgi:hypothetical protein
VQLGKVVRVVEIKAGDLESVGDGELHELALSVHTKEYGQSREGKDEAVWFVPMPATSNQGHAKILPKNFGMATAGRLAIQRAPIS